MLEYLRGFGAEPELLGDAISVQMSVETAEEMFQTELHNFVDENGRQLTRQLGEYSISNEIAGIVDFVSGLSEFPIPRSSAPKGASSTFF